MTARAVRHLDRLRHRKRVVGLAFAVAGKLSSVRWFSDHGVYRRFRTQLLNTAATEALIAKKPKRRRCARVTDIKRFLARLKKARRLRTDKRRYNKNFVFAGDEVQGYMSSSCYVAPKTLRRAAPAPVTVDHSARSKRASLSGARQARVPPGQPRTAQSGPPAARCSPGRLSGGVPFG